MTLHLIATSLDPNDDGMPTKMTFNKSEVVIGRLPSCDLPLGDSTVSATHAKLTIKKDSKTGLEKVFVEDLGSSNGTSVESTKLSPFARMAVEPDQWIRTGQYLIKAVLDKNILFNGIVNNEIELTPELECSDTYPLSSILEHGSDLGLSTHLEGKSDIVSSLNTLASPKIEDLTINKEEGKKMECIESNNQTCEQSYKTFVKSDDIKGLDFEAFKIVLVNGIVTYSDGTPISGAEINAGVLGVTSSNYDGTFSFGPIPEGTPYEISVLFSGLKFEMNRVEGHVTEDQIVEFKAIKTFSVSGRVLRNGVPISEVFMDAGEFGSTYTNSEGRYEITGIPANAEFEIKASKDGYGFGKQTVHIDS